MKFNILLLSSIIVVITSCTKKEKIKNSDAQQSTDASKISEKADNVIDKDSNLAYKDLVETKTENGRILENNIFKIKISSIDGEVGEIIKINNKKTNNDLTISEEATYYVAMIENYLITDAGTGPSNRSISIYNVQTGKIIHDNSYEGDIKIDGYNVSYKATVEISDNESKPNCDQSMIDNGFTMGYVEDQYFDLKTLKLIKTGKVECWYFQ